MKRWDIIERMRALAATAPFDTMTGPELMLVAGHIRLRSFAPGAEIIASGHVADRLYVVVGGSATVGDKPAPAHFDAASLLFSLPVAHGYLAGPDGLEALCLAKPHLFTIARLRPDFIAALVDMKRIAL